MANAAAVIAGRDYKVYQVPYSSTNLIPVDTVAYGTAWATPPGQSLPWVESGYVTGGLHFSIGQDFSEIRVDQEVDPILYVPNGRDLRMSTTIAEITAANIKATTGTGTITTVAAASGTRGHDDLDITGTIVLAFTSVGFDIKAPGDGEAFRIVGWKCLPTGAPSIDIVTTDAAGIAFEARCLPDTSVTPARVMKIRDVIAALP
jgi:hypothetical protein